MLITKEWSEPKPVAFGKNILVRSSHPNFAFRIHNGKGQSVEGVILDRVHSIVADNELIRRIETPMISFKANTSEELHVDFEIV